MYVWNETGVTSYYNAQVVYYFARYRCSWQRGNTIGHLTALATINIHREYEKVT
jgi:phosphoribosyl-AMP cyclohydrolase